MLVHISNRQKDLPLNKGAVKALVEGILEHLKISAKEIGVYFVTEKKIAELHNRFFQDPTPTDCISFPLDESHLGEIFICPSVAIKYAKERQLDAYAETTLYIIHSILHLLGFDDLEAKKRRTMRKKEKSCMRHLYKHNIVLSQ